MSSKRKHSVGLRFFGDGLEPDEITAILGIQPTESHRRGDIRRTRSGRAIGEWREGAWLYKEKSDDVESIEEALASFVRRLSESKEKIRSISCRPDVRLADISSAEFGSSGSQFPSIGLNLSSLEALAEMGLEFGCTLHGWQHWF